jgi:lipopolysaccharide export system permease protein
MSIPELLHPDPHTSLLRDRGKFLVEANRRVTAPFTAISFAMVALVSVLAGAFSRHGNIVRPMAAIGVVVALLASGLVIQNVAARVPALIPLIWVHAIGPGLVAALMLFKPERGARRAPAAHAAGAAA